MKQLSILIIVLAILSISITWFGFPQTASKGLLFLNNAAAGLSEKTVNTPLGDIHYLEGGEGETVVLLHGIFARKEHWVDMARNLTDEFHIIALDLPGFGDNTSLGEQQYQLQQQANNLNTVLTALKIESAHFGVNSMGAMVAGILANQRPELMQSLAFIGSPLGVPTQIKSDMQTALLNGHIPLLVKTEQDFIDRNQWLFPKTPAIPGPIFNSWMQKESANPIKNAQIWQEANNFGSTPTLLEMAPTLTMKSLIVWCNEDRIFHISGATILDQALPDSQVEVLDNCGHLPMLDKPNIVSDIYSLFLSNQSIQAN